MSVPSPSDFERHIITDYNFQTVIDHINLKMLYNKHLGFKKDIRQLQSQRDSIFLKTKEQIDALLKEAVTEGILKASCIYRFFPAQSSGDSVHIYNTSQANFRPQTFTFPRQDSGEKLCLSDFVAPSEQGIMDYIAMFIGTCGLNVHEQSEKWRREGKFVKSHLLNIIAITCAEALGEALHCEIRRVWGFADADNTTIEDKLSSKYRGKRFSFGYSPCPELAYQKKLFTLLKPEEIGIKLTDGFMMEPEASVSAIVLHNPKAKYFTI